MFLDNADWVTLGVVKDQEVEVIENEEYVIFWCESGDLDHLHHEVVIWKDVDLLLVQNRHVKAVQVESRIIVLVLKFYLKVWDFFIIKLSPSVSLKPTLFFLLKERVSFRNLMMPVVLYLSFFSDCLP